jgi:penicillin-binding protein 2
LQRGIVSFGNSRYASRMRLFLAVLLGCVMAQAAESGKVCDRNGILLMEVERKDDGSVAKKFPLKAFAAHLLSDLRDDVLPPPGETLFLTLDARVQMAAETSLRAVPRGCAIVVDPKNGDVLALASVPSFDPAAPEDPALRQDETEPLRNRAASAYAPGALYLPVTLLAGISAGLASFEHTCTGSQQFGNQVMKCWMTGKGGGHGSQNLTAGLRNSCNTFFYSLAVATGPEKIASMAEALGLGKSTGLPLKTEAPGDLGDPKSFARLNPSAKWTDRFTATMGIGQGSLLVSPLQMASLAATLAEDGTIRPLRVIDRVVRADGTMVDSENRVAGDLKELGVSPDDFRLIRAGLLASVNDKLGSAQKAKIPGFQVGGRTGTAQFWRNGEKDRQAGILGFAESEKDRYAFCVFVQGASSGGTVAAPLAARMISSIGKNEPAALEPAKGSLEFVEIMEGSNSSTP